MYNNYNNLNQLCWMGLFTIKQSDGENRHFYIQKLLEEKQVEKVLVQVVGRGDSVSELYLCD